MDFHILVEKHPHNGFVATALGWPDCVGAGETKDEAIVQVRAAVAKRLSQGELLHIKVEDSLPKDAIDPWEAMAGRFADDPTWPEYEEELRRIREEANRD